MANLTRREFLFRSSAALAGAALLEGPLELLSPKLARAATTAKLAPYTGPNVVLVRFGGGVRRRETIEESTTYAPYFLHELFKRGTLFKNMEISAAGGIETGHGQGTLRLLTGRYKAYKNVNESIIGDQFIPTVPTLFEYIRKNYDIPEHQVLIVNGEDRTDEEFYTFSNHHLFGVSYRSTVLSLYWYKVYLLRRQIEEGIFDGQKLQDKKKELNKLEGLDYRSVKPAPAKEVDAFWARYRKFYGDSGLVNARGDALLTQLSIRAIRELQPRLLMINYNDPDYVHWGFPSHYFRGISIIDRGLQQLVEAIEAEEFYRNNTLIIIVPDCGRDDNPFIRVPYQHHFNSRSAREIFALFIGPHVPPGKVIQKKVDQTAVAPTIAQLMGLKADFSEGDLLESVFG